MNGVVVQATRLGCLAREADEVECIDIAVQHSMDPNVLHY